jgi:hypothetical protein
MNNKSHCSTFCGLVTQEFLTQYCAGGKIEKNEMGGSCRAYGRGESYARGVGGEARGKETIGETQT